MSQILKEVTMQTNLQKLRIQVDHSSCKCRLSSVQQILGMLGAINIQMESNNNERIWAFEYSGEINSIEQNLIQGGFTYKWM